MIYFKNFKKFIFFLILTFLITSGVSCFQGVPADVQQRSKPLTLEMWGVWDGGSDFSSLLAEYKKLHPNISINYRKFRYEEYEQKLLEAFAKDQGPDIFAIHNTWVKKYQDVITPMPKQTSLVYTYETGTIKKETVSEIRATASITPKDLRAAFVDQVAKDVIIPGIDANKNFIDQIYGLPLSVDTLALFYNKDILNLSGIPTPPANWKDFQDQVKKTTKLDKEGKILQAGAALGTGKNVSRSFDILSLLMMQNGAVMQQGINATFDRIPEGQSRNISPGEEALRFYTDFASPSKEVYSWNAAMPNSLDYFAQGNAAFFFGYSYQIPDIKNKAPKLNFGIVKVPQIEGNPEINYANYWVYTASKKTKYIDEAWDFIQFLAKKDSAQKYLVIAKKPAALRSLIPSQLENESLAPFAAQLLTARSWYQGVNPSAAETAFVEMIDLAASGQYKFTDLISQAVGRIQQTIR